jgi:hypothetical protein
MRCRCPDGIGFMLFPAKVARWHLLRTHRNQQTPGASAAVFRLSCGDILNKLDALGVRDCLLQPFLWLFRVGVAGRAAERDHLLDAMNNQEVCDVDSRCDVVRPDESRYGTLEFFAGKPGYRSATTTGTCALLMTLSRPGELAIETGTTTSASTLREIND